ncbi:MAG: DNA polymerase III subunit delta' [Parahaliea sp.]
MNLSELPAISAPLPWQLSCWQNLQQQREQARLPHALLLAGVGGIGKTRLALALARLLLCHKPNAGLNCGQCAACQYSSKGSHGDFYWLQPQVDSRVIKIDQVRALIEFANQTAGFGARKVLVIAPADAMNTNAANALLKSLEEPPANTHLILVCQQLSSLPATIRSRCQLLRLPLPDTSQSLNWLDSVTGKREQSRELLQLAQGRPLLARQLYTHSGVETLQAVQRSFSTVLTGELTLSQALALLESLSATALIAHLEDFVQQRIRTMSGYELATTGQQAFCYLDDLRHMQLAVAAGSNPNRQLLGEYLLLNLKACLLGHNDGSAKMPPLML